MSTPSRPVPPAILANQHAIVRGLLASLRPHWRRDRALPARIEAALKADRRFGSRDRRLYRELTYTALRYLPWIEALGEDEAVGLIAHLCDDTPATASFRARYAQPPEAPLDESALLPEWIANECPAALEPPQRAALLRRAPVWIRLQTDDPAAVWAEFAQTGLPAAAPGPWPDAFRFPPDTALTRTRAYEQGQIEIQDLGSQWILASAAPAADEHWLDACAGAGGKTLQLARLLGPSGRVVAHDVRAAALAELAERARRAGVTTVRIAAQPEGTFDGVLVDAPCTGSGTWRRAPHLKWTTRLADVAAAAEKQLQLLRRFSARVRPGGRLIYATCSLCRSENDGVVSRFLAAEPDFVAEALPRTFGVSPGPLGCTLLPATFDTDGFYVAALRRRA